MFGEEEKETMLKDTCEVGTMKNSLRKKMKRHLLLTELLTSGSHEGSISISPMEDEYEAHARSIMKMQRNQQKEKIGNLRSS